VLAFGYSAILYFVGISQRESLLKQKRNLEELKNNIEQQTVANTDPETLRKVSQNTVKGIKASIQECDGYFQHLLQISSPSSS